MTRMMTAPEGFGILDGGPHSPAHAWVPSCDFSPECIDVNRRMVPDDDYDGGGDGHSEEHDWDPDCDVDPVCVDVNPDAVVGSGPDTGVPKSAADTPSGVSRRNFVVRDLDPPVQIGRNLTRADGTPLGSYDPPPTHYDGPNGISPWAIWDAFDLDRYTANAVKYLLRAGKKANTPRMDDLVKARNYINKAIEMEEKHA